jgi:protein TonB
MRKVYQGDRGALRLALSIFFSVGFTALLFGILPFTHLVAKPTRTLELRKTSAMETPPPVEEETEAPPPEEEQPPELAKDPQLADPAAPQVPISADLEVAMGTGGALAGFGALAAPTKVEAIQQEAFDVGDLEKRPETVSQVAPAYPRALQKAKIEGTVTLVFLLTEEGRVEDPRVENSTRPEFEAPALEAIRKWRFKPGMKDGQPVRSFIRIPMKFKVGAG